MKSDNFNNEQVKMIREFLYQMAQIEFMNYKKQKGNEKSSHLFKSFN